MADIMNTTGRDVCFEHLSKAVMLVLEIRNYIWINICWNNF